MAVSIFNPQFKLKNSSVSAYPTLLSRRTSEALVRTRPEGENRRIKDQFAHLNFSIQSRIQTCSLVLSSSYLLRCLSIPSYPLFSYAFPGVNAACDSGLPGYTHIVNPGETCWGIATQGRIDVARLETANPSINCDSLAIGQASCDNRPKILTGLLTHCHYRGSAFPATNVGS